MKRIITISLAIFLALTISAQEETLQLLEVFSIQDTSICESATITALHFQVTKVTVDNSTEYPDVRIDTTLIRAGNCPADSAQVATVLQLQAEGIQNQAANSMSRAFDFTRRPQSEFQEIRSVFNVFTGSDLYISSEEKYWGTYAGRYRIVDIQGDSSWLATMVRVGASSRYRLEIEPGEPRAGTRYPVIPLSRRSFQVNNIELNGQPARNHRLYLDRAATVQRPVFREEGYLEGGIEDELRIIKIE